MKKFQIFKSDGKPETIEAERVIFTKKKDGLSIKFLIGNKVTIKYSKVILLIEISPEIVQEQTPKQNIYGDDE